MPDPRRDVPPAENRAALVVAAREVFADQGIDAPLRAVARRAGVGQGSLYRHFPDRVSLALAAFEENVAALERLVADPGSTLADCFDLLTEQSLAAVAFIAMLNDLEDPRIAVQGERVEELLAQKLPGAQRAGLVRPDVSPADCFLAVAMVGAIASQSLVADRRVRAEQAWRLLRRGLAPER
jgi:AcrR family transcriptional regulator